MSTYSRLQQLESCIQIFLTDTSQYLIISGNTPEERSAFLEEFSHLDAFSHKKVRRGKINSYQDLEELLGETDARITEIIFLDFAGSVDYATIRTIIDAKMIDSKIVITSATPVDNMTVTNFRLPDGVDTSASTPEVTPVPLPTDTEAWPDIPADTPPVDPLMALSGDDPLTPEDTVDTPTPAHKTTSPTPKKVVARREASESTPMVASNTLSFREYSENQGLSISVPDILAKNTSLEHLQDIFSRYILSGGGKDIDTEQDDFSEKMTVMSQELFEKEKEVFVDYIRTLAMNVGNLYKEDQIAKLMNISRRKVKKYTDILLKHQVISAIHPFVEDPHLELSRHVKLYFADLSYYRAALDVIYAVGSSRTGVIENFVYLELVRKLSDSHEIFFWRKKSGTSLQFILTHRDTARITPIEITLRATSTLSQAMKSFYDSYGERIEYGMLLNESEAAATTYDGKTFIILPHPVI